MLFRVANHFVHVPPSLHGDKMARYFGFAQQVGVELELSSILPEGLRHCLAFMSVAVTMSLGTDKVPSPQHSTLWAAVISSGSPREQRASPALRKKTPLSLAPAWLVVHYSRQVAPRLDAVGSVAGRG